MENRKLSLQAKSKRAFTSSNRKCVPRTNVWFILITNHLTWCVIVDNSSSSSCNPNQNLHQNLELAFYLQSFPLVGSRLWWHTSCTLQASVLSSQVATFEVNCTSLILIPWEGLEYLYHPGPPHPYIPSPFTNQNTSRSRHQYM
jgi:hypothetical protein